MDIEHVVIDEAQDLGLFHFDILKTIFPNATFLIFGDLNQSIYSFRSISDWSYVINDVFENKCELLDLNKSYRTTREIVEASNSVLAEVNCEQATSVLRHGEPFIACESSGKETSQRITEILGDFRIKGYNSVGIITKDEAETVKLHKELENLGTVTSKITYDDAKYNGGVCVLPSYLSKGLEFDAVIMSDCSEKKYDPKSVTDMKLLYVAMTRPLHELVALYNKTLTKPLNSYLGLDKSGPKLAKIIDNK